jgi:hypothetical protein
LEYLQSIKLTLFLVWRCRLSFIFLMWKNIIYMSWTEIFLAAIVLFLYDNWFLILPNFILLFEFRQIRAKFCEFIWLPELMRKIILKGTYHWSWVLHTVCCWLYLILIVSMYSWLVWILWLLWCVNRLCWNCLLILMLKFIVVFTIVLPEINRDWTQIGGARETQWTTVAVYGGPRTNAFCQIS